MLKQYIVDVVETAIREAVSDNKLGQMTATDVFSVNVETPKNEEFGDFAVNVSALARCAKMAPPLIAQVVSEYINIDDCKISIVAGFINFKLGKSFLNTIIKDIINLRDDYARSSFGEGQKVLLEYVSANPTGPFHIGHGRWAAMGSALANLLKFAGYDVYQEFYINDAGNQIKNLGRSLHIRVLQELGIDIDFPTDEVERKSFYPGEYLIPVAKDFVKEKNEFAKTLSNVILLTDFLLF